MINKNNEEHDVYETSLQSLKKKNQSQLRIEAILSLYSMLGLLVAVMGGAYFLLNTFDVSFSTEQQVGVFLFILGLLMSICSKSFLVYIKQKKNKYLI